MKRPANGDPTPNVRQMLVAEADRLDALRIASERRVDELAAAEKNRIDEILHIRGDFYAQLAVAESKRIDAIRAVDVAAVGVANERATAQATVLANQVATSAETLRALVATQAAATAQQFATATSQLSDRISLLERSSYEGQGKSTLADPALTKMVAELEALRTGASEGRGRAGLSTTLMAALAAGGGGIAMFVLQNLIHVGR